MKQVKIGEAFSSIRNGATIQQDKVVDGTPITRIETIADGTVDLNRLGYASVQGENFKDFYLQEGDILMSHINSVAHLGKVAIFENRNEKIIHGMNLLCLKTNPEKLLPKYAFYYLKSLRFRSSIKKITKKSVNQASFNISNLKELEIPLPSHFDQIQIANILSKAETLIEQRKQSIALLDEFLKSSFLEMFYTNPETENWNEVKFEELAAKKKGSMRTGPFGSSLLHGEFTESGDVKVLGIDNVVTNRFDWKRSRCITFEKFQELKRYQVYPNDVLISIMATLGRTAVVPKDIPICINSKHLAAITLDREIANPYFVAFAFHSHPLIVRQMSNNVKGAIMDGLNLTIIRRIKLKLPPVELQNKFGETFEKTEALKTQYQQSLLELENLYGSLSQQAFKGELEIKKQVALQ